MKAVYRPSKNDLIRAILSNPTYLPESGVYRMVRSALEKLSRDALGNLKLIVEIKIGHV